MAHANSAGNFEKALTHAKQLYVALKEVNFDAWLIDRNLMYLEDQSFAE